MPTFPVDVIHKPSNGDDIPTALQNSRSVFSFSDGKSHVFITLFADHSSSEV
jgi:hypothetical protein